MITFLVILVSIQNIECIVYMNVNFNNKTEVNMYETYVKMVCQSRNDICKAGHKNVCAVRKKYETMEYKDFENSCQVFMHNFCDSPDQEYYIVTTGKCETYLQTRRNEDSLTYNDAQSIAEGNDQVTEENDQVTEENDQVTEGNDETTLSPEGDDETEIMTEESTTDEENTTKAILRQQTTKASKATTKQSNTTKASNTTKKSNTTKASNTTKKANTTKASNTTKAKVTTKKSKTTKFVPLYEVDTAFDDHICPMSCPDIYSPVCVSANRGNGMYFKFFTFVNHCTGDLYYCKNPDEFAPAPDESAEDVNASKLGWSYCGASRYLQFARFSEAVSSLGYYGWLSGEQKYSHIMEPHERKPGYG